MESSTRKTRRVVIVDDSRTSQAIVETAFEDKRDFTVVGVASDAAEGARLVRQLVPDLVTIDLCMPYLDGSALLEMLGHMRDVCKIIVSESFSNNVAVIARLEELGASLCLRKTDLKVNPVTFSIRSTRRSSIMTLPGCGAAGRGGSRIALNGQARLQQSGSFSVSQFLAMRKPVFVW
jgi:chemotaxis response regulator CheB